MYLTSWSRVLNKTLTVPEIIQKFLAFDETRRFIIAFTSVSQLTLFRSRSIQTMPRDLISQRSVLTSSSQIRLGLLSGLFTSGLLTKSLYAPHLSPIRATCPAHLILLDVIARIIFGEQYSPWSSTLRSRLHSLVTCPLWPGYLSQHPILEHPQTVFLRHCERPSFIPTQNNKTHRSNIIYNFWLKRGGSSRTG